MTWVKLEDTFTEHPKVCAAGALASWLYVCGLTYANRNLTDGFIPDGAVRRLAEVKNPGALARRLVEVQLWERAEGGYRIHDYLDYQPSAQKVSQTRDRTASRVAGWRARKNGTPDAPVTPLRPRPVTEGVTPDVTPPPARSRPGPGPGVEKDLNREPPPPPPDAAAAAGDGGAAALVALSDSAQSVVEHWQTAHGRRGPPKLNPTQRAKLEKAVVELGPEALKASATWTAERGLPEFDKAINAAYTARRHSENGSGDAKARGDTGGARNGTGGAAAGAGAGSAGRPKRFAQYVIRDPAPG